MFAAKGPKPWIWRRTWTPARQDLISTRHPAHRRAVGQTGTTETEVIFLFLCDHPYLPPGRFVRHRCALSVTRLNAAGECVDKPECRIGDPPLSSHANTCDQSKHLTAAELSLTLRRAMSYCTSVSPPVSLRMNCNWFYLHMNLLNSLKIHTMTEIAPGFPSHINVSTHLNLPLSVNLRPLTPVA